MYKLCFPLKPEIGGGVFSFSGNFINYLNRIQYSWTGNLEADYERLLVCAWHPSPEEVERAKKRSPNLKIIHRVDGSAMAYGRYDNSDEKLKAINVLADITIFQSEYSRTITRRQKLIAVDGPVIYNPVDLNVFKPARKGKRDIRICSAQWSTNIKKGAAAILAYADVNPEVSFHLIGRYPTATSLPNVHFEGTADHAKMADKLCQYDIFLNLSENDPCPNIVIEALACGLPVIFKPSGGVPELVGDAGVSIRNGFLNAYRHIGDNLSEMSLRAISRSQMFDLEKIGRQYIQAVESI